MDILNLTDLGDLLSEYSKNTWDRLHFVSDSYSTRGKSAPMRFGEDTITDLLLMELFMAGSTLVQFKHTSKQQEARTGTDFELWVGSQTLGWFKFAIQAKKLHPPTKRYHALGERNQYGAQHHLLHQFSLRQRSAPIYCLYNYSNQVSEPQHWRCCMVPFNPSELGCSVTSHSVVDYALTHKGKRTFDSIHRNAPTLPLRCLVSCPKVQQSLLSKAANISPPKPREDTPLFDPDSCYHQSIPTLFRPDSGVQAIRRNNNGGVILSVTLGRNGQLSQSEDQISDSARRDFAERYPTDGGAPKSVAVIDLLAST